MKEIAMRLQIIDIGNSKGIRLPQAVLKQVMFGNEVEMEVLGGRITLKRVIDATFIPDFMAIADLDDITIQQVLRKINGSDLITALVGAEERVKEAIYRNMSERVKAYVIPTVERLEKGDARDLIIERGRNAICEAMMEIVAG
jgi:antitoxin component of MazEF toxin-antitoxin module